MATHSGLAEKTVARHKADILALLELHTNFNDKSAKGGMSFRDIAQELKIARTTTKLMLTELFRDGLVLRYKPAKKRNRAGKLPYGREPFVYYLPQKDTPPGGATMPQPAKGFPEFKERVMRLIPCPPPMAWSPSDRALVVGGGLSAGEAQQIEQLAVETFGTPVQLEFLPLDNTKPPEEPPAPPPPLKFPEQPRRPLVASSFREWLTKERPGVAAMVHGIPMRYLIHSKTLVLDGFKGDRTMEMEIQRAILEYFGHDTSPLFTPPPKVTPNGPPPAPPRTPETKGVEDTGTGISCEVCGALVGISLLNKAARVVDCNECDVQYLVAEPKNQELQAFRITTSYPVRVWDARRAK